MGAGRLGGATGPNLIGRQWPTEGLLCQGYIQHCCCLLGRWLMPARSQQSEVDTFEYPLQRKNNTCPEFNGH